METKQLGLYYHPTTAVLIDDNQSFLNALSLKLDSDILYKLFTDPQAALDFITNEKEPYIRKEPILLDLDDESDSKSSNFKLSLHTIMSPLIQKKRFDEITVIVVDFSMPYLDGCAFIDKLLEKVGNHFIKIIMVTGEADQSLAVELFNAGKIHLFLLKDEPRLENKINEGIKTMQSAYFADRSYSILNTLASTTIPALNDSVFIEEFFKICQKYKIIEYYLFENTGSFILLDKSGTTRLLILRMQDDLNMYAEMAEDLKVEPKYISQIKEGKALPFFGTFERFTQSNGSEWSGNLYAAKIIQGKHKYYYTIIENFVPSILPMPQNILSFKDYVDQSWKP